LRSAIRSVPILASGTKGNPRQIKRFLNTLLLRERRRSRADSAKTSSLPVLAKLMLAERFIPSAVRPDRLSSRPFIPRGSATTSAQSLEEPSRRQRAQMAEKARRMSERAKPADVVAPAEELSAAWQWKVTEAMCSTGRACSLLDRALDLRPISSSRRTRRTTSARCRYLGHLAAVVDKLFGGKMTVQGYTKPN
jgi:hypothetical protein